MATRISHDWRSERLRDEDRLHPDERQMLQVFKEHPLIPSPGDLRKKLPGMDRVAAHVAVCNLVISGYVNFSAEGYRLIRE